MKRYNKLGHMYNDTTIDWDWLIAGYNRRYGTNFKTEKDMYLRCVLSLSLLGRRLGVAQSTIYRRYDRLGIPRSHKRGGANYTKTPGKDRFLSIPAEEMALMSVDRIAAKLKLGESSVRNYLRKTGRVFRRKAANRVKGE